MGLAMRTALRRWSVSVFVLCTAIWSGCSEQPQPEPVAEKPPRKADWVEQDKPIQFEECTQFALDMQEAIQSADVRAMNALLDWGAIFDAATFDCDFDPADRDRYVRLVASAQNWSSELLNEINNGDALRGQYTLLRIHGDSDAPGVWFRMLPKSGGVVYHDYRLARCEDGLLRATDIFISGAGENVSQVMRPFFMIAIEQESRGMLARLMGREAQLRSRRRKYRSY